MKKTLVIAFLLSSLWASAPASAIEYRYHPGTPTVAIDEGVLNPNDQPAAAEAAPSDAPIPLHAQAPVMEEPVQKHLSQPFFTAPDAIEPEAPPVFSEPPKESEDATVLAPPARADKSLRGYVAKKTPKKVAVPADEELTDEERAAIAVPPAKAPEPQPVTVKALPAVLVAPPVKPVAAPVPVVVAPVKAPEPAKPVAAPAEKSTPPADVTAPVVSAPAKAAPVPDVTTTASPAKTDNAVPVKTDEKPPEAPPADKKPDSSAPAEVSLNFEAASSVMSPLVQKQLDDMVTKLQNAPDIRVQIRAFAKGDDSGQSNARRMSLSRALVVRRYLTEKGIKPVRLDVRALGTETDRTPLDRVDLVFIK